MSSVTDPKQTPNIPDYETPPGADPNVKRWRAGTLVYTSAGLVALFCWLLWGDFAWSMKERSVGAVVQLLLKKHGSTDFTNGLLIGSLPAAVTMLLGPIISYRSDRHRGPWGRRIPYLIITTPFAALSMVGLAFSPAMGRAVHAALGTARLSENNTVLIFFGLFWTIFEFATIAANSVFGGLINDVVPRPFLGRFYGLFRALSLIAGMIFNFWLLGKAEGHYVWVFIGIGLLYGLGFTAMCLKVREGEYPPPPPAAANSGVADGFFIAARQYFKECFSNPYYIWVFVALNVATICFVPVNLFSLFFAKSLSMSMDTYGKYLALTYLISLGLSYFLGALADRFHPLRVGIAALVLYAVVTLWGGIYATNTRAFAFAFVAHGVLSGTYFTASASLAQRLFPHSRFAQFASAAGMLGAVSSIVLGPAVGRFLDYTGHVYRYTFVASFGLTVLAIVSMLVVHGRFVELGGPHHYVAPGSDDADATSDAVHR